MDPDDQKFMIEASIKSNSTDISFKGSTENELYYAYIDFIKARRPLADSLRMIMDTLATEDSSRLMYSSRLDELDREVELYTDSFIAENEGTIAAQLLKANKQIDVPEARDNSKEEQLKRFNYFKYHFFDNVDLGSPITLRTPFLFEKVKYYIDKLTYNHPDSLAKSIDYILSEMEPAPETFRYYLSSFLNKYAKSKIVGMDAVYVHLADNYYAKGKAPWISDDQLKKIVRNTNGLRPTLVGKTAPNLSLQNREGKKIQLHDIKADYTILYFWRPNCGHCKKSTPKLIEFYKAYKPKGVEVITICTKFNDDTPKCWEYVDSLDEMDIFYNLVDPHHVSRFQSIYYIKTTPKLLVFDKNKKIISKGIGVEQLEDVINHFLKLDQDEKNAEQEGK
jgi:thiol-disulfide isomerase/thioredoxin